MQRTLARRTLPSLSPLAASIGISSTALLVLLAALPLLFLHIEYQPSFMVGRAQIVLSDLAVLAVGASAAVVAARRGPAPLSSAKLVWAGAAALLLLIVAACFYPIAYDRAYDWRTHLVTAGKFAEYALLALGVPLLVRTRRDLEAVLWVMTAWCALASAIAFIQFVGVDILDAWPAGRRQPSFIGHHDFAAFSGAVTTIALVALALPQRRIPRRLALASGIAGGVGVVLSGSTAGAIGLGAAALAALIVGRLRGGASARRLAGIVVIAVVCAGGVLVLRGGDVDQFLRFVGLREKEKTGQIETYVQRTLLAYIGWKIFLDDPVVGAGWQASTEYSTYGPHLADARREFPDAAPQSFPSPEHPYGVQNAYVQALADLGIVGLVVFLAFLAAGLWTGARRALRAPPEASALLGVAFLLVAMGVWSAQGLIAGSPLDAVAWLSLGLVGWRGN